MSALLTVEGLVKSFGVRVIDDLSLSVEPGDALGVVGPNGAGKTTMLNLLAGDLSPDEGRVLFQGEDVTRTPAEARCRMGIARTSQIPRPFEGMTVFENVLVGAVFGSGMPRREADAVDIVVSSLERAGMLADANRTAGSLPLLGRKRLELARALSTEPTILLLDEIAGGLTEGEVDELVGTIQSIHADGVTIVWIEHIVHALLRVVDRIMAMSFGVKIAEGEPETVMASPEVQEVYMGVEPE